MDKKVVSYWYDFFDADDVISARGGLADKQSTGLFGPCVRYAHADKMLRIFLPTKSRHLYKTKRTYHKGCLTVMTGYEPHARNGDCSSCGEREKLALPPLGVGGICWRKIGEASSTASLCAAV